MSEPEGEMNEMQELIESLQNALRDKIFDFCQFNDMPSAIVVGVLELLKSEVIGMTFVDEDGMDEYFEEHDG